MSDVPLPSLLARDDAQPALFSLPAVYQAKQDAEGQYTADRLFSRDPEKYKAVVALLAAGRGIRSIKRACGVHHDTIHAVAARERIAIDTLKERIVKDLEVAIQVGAERAVEVMESMDGDKLPLALGILIDKLQLLTGGATMRVETSDVTPSTKEPASFEDWLAGLKTANGPKMGLGEGGKGQMGGGLAGSGGAGEVVHRLAAPITDAVSLAGQSTAARATAGATAVAVREASIDQGEGGVAEPGGGPAGPTHSESGNFDAMEPPPAGAGVHTHPPPDDQP